MNHSALSNLLNQLSLSIQSGDSEKSMSLVNDCHSYVDGLNNKLLESLINAPPLTVDQALLAMEKDALYIQLKNYIHEDHWFSDQGMIVKLTNVIDKGDCVSLVINGSLFEDFNIHKMEYSYYPNTDTDKKISEGIIQDKELFNAYEAGWYVPIDTLYWTVILNDSEVENPTIKEVFQSLLEQDKVVFKTA